MLKPAPHVIPYQGSKRKLADRIMTFVPDRVQHHYEPFAGSAAITLSAAANGRAQKFVISDKLEPLSDLWKMIIDKPEKLIEEYSVMWNEQLDDPATFYKKMRDEFNRSKSPSILLYLIARCVKNAIRFNNNGEFNQGPDNRRLGLKPEKLAREVRDTSKLLKGRAEVFSGDFRTILASATQHDIVYMDPPWQGTSGKRDPRYAFLLNLDDLLEELESLNVRDIPYILSFDGACGDRTYGAELPQDLRLKKVSLSAGRSSQATLLGRNEETIESLYLSPSLISKLNLNSGSARSKHSQAELRL